jgi:hypothetical protein
MICKAMIGQPIALDDSALVAAELRLFAEGLLMIADSHRSWLKSDAGTAAQRASDASQRFKILRFAPYANRANNLTELLQIWQKLSLGASPDEAASISADNGPMIRALLGVRDADDTIRQRLHKLRPSRALGILQFATNFNPKMSRPIGEFDLPRVLERSNNEWHWTQKQAHSLEEADHSLRQMMEIAPESPVPLVAD